MKAFIRRITIVPLFIMGSPILWSIAWLFGDVKEANEFVKELIELAWTGEIR